MNFLNKYISTSFIMLFYLMIFLLTNSCVEQKKSLTTCYQPYLSQSYYVNTGYCSDLSNNNFVALNFNDFSLLISNNKEIDKMHYAWVYNYYWQKNYQKLALFKLSLFLKSYGSINLSNQYHLFNVALSYYDKWRYIDFDNDLTAKGYDEQEKSLLHIAFLLQEQNQHTKADKIYEKLLENKDLATQVSLKKIAELQKKYHKQNEYFLDAITKVSSYSKFINKNYFSQTADKLQKHAYKLSKKNRILEASEHYLQFSSKAKIKKDKARGCFLSGFLLYEANLYSLSQIRFAQCQEDIKYSKYQEESLWYQAFMFIINKNYQASLTLLQKLNFYKTTQKDKYDYFTAFVFTKLKEKQKAQKLLQDIIKRPQINYYTVLAYKALQHQPDEKIIKNFKQANIPHENIVNSISNKYNINKSLLYAIMHAESRFISSAISYKGAKGLMQVMPSVAKDLALKANIKNFTEEKLHEPKINIKLAGVMIADLQQKFNKPYLSIAAYNAGAYRVKKWLNSFGNLSDELFIERIPFKQTREYIKKVLHNQLIYNALLNKSVIAS